MRRKKKKTARGRSINDQVCWTLFKMKPKLTMKLKMRKNGKRVQSSTISMTLRSMDPLQGISMRTPDGIICGSKLTYFEKCFLIVFSVHNFYLTHQFAEGGRIGGIPSEEICG